LPEQDKCGGGTRARLSILGTRGLPSAHSGFESFVARLAPYLVARGWDIEVYCQDETGQGAAEWNGVRLVQIPDTRGGSLGSIIFDAKSVWRAAGEDRLVLTMGYNTAVFGLLLRVRGRKNIYNMDGIEWRRAKWKLPVKIWFFVNELLACAVGNHLIADHPSIARHLSTRLAGGKTTMIPYCADPVLRADPALLVPLGLEPDRYALVICRPEPENSILEIVRAFSQKPRGQKLVVLGRYRPETNPYHRQVLAAASEEVIFPGAIFDDAIVGALRRFALVYVHGHQVGGTNPSLVEALAAPAAVLARDNHFNRWVAGPSATYFRDERDCAAAFAQVLAMTRAELAAARAASAARHAQFFTAEKVLGAYRTLLERYLP
jgi:glycosyltransferase involved in cell wall biosynthesis